MIEKYWGWLVIAGIVVSIVYFVHLNNKRKVKVIDDVKQPKPYDAGPSVHYFENISNDTMKRLHLKALKQLQLWALSDLNIQDLLTKVNFSNEFDFHSFDHLVISVPAYDGSGGMPQRHVIYRSDVALEQNFVVGGYGGITEEAMEKHVFNLITMIRLMEEIIDFNIRLKGGQPQPPQNQ